MYIKNQDAIPSEMVYNNSKFTNGNEIVNGFAKYFSSTYKNINLNLNNHDICNNCIILNNIVINEIDMINAFKEINFNTAPGPDKIHPKFIKNTGLNISIPLLYIFRKSISTGIFPNQWKASFITPIHKSGNKNMINNYRPITIINVFAKLFECIIYKKVLSHLNQYFIIEQHGSLEKKSIETNLLTFKEDIIDNFINNSRTYAIYTDVKKAFDTINHKLETLY